MAKLEVRTFAHPQGCRSYLLSDPESRQAMSIDPHLDLVDGIAAAVSAAGLTLPYVVDTHTHADHPSGSAELAARFQSTRIAHEKARHHGVTRHPADGDTLHLGDLAVRVAHAPGHTPDHIVLLIDSAVFSGDTLLIGGVARTDFLGGDAGELYDSLRRIFDPLPDDTVLYPGHDYNGLSESSLGHERRNNPWLAMSDRAAFVSALTADKPRRPANMDALLELNREGSAIATSVSANKAVESVAAGAGVSVIDVRTVPEYRAQRVPGTRHIPLDELRSRADEIRATPAPRLLLCKSGKRAEVARAQLSELGIAGLTVIEGGIDGFAAAGGETVGDKNAISLERQVRIAAGTLALLGAVLGFVVHPGFHALSGFVGAGLIFAGITDFCGMGLLLAKMPWNRAAPSDAGAPQVGTCSASAPVGGCAASLPPTGGCAASAPSAPGDDRAA